MNIVVLFLFFFDTQPVQGFLMKYKSENRDQFLYDETDMNGPPEADDAPVILPDSMYASKSDNLAELLNFKSLVLQIIYPVSLFVSVYI